MAGKNWFEGVPGPLVFNIVVRYWCKRKMLKRNWRNNRFFCQRWIRGHKARDQGQGHKKNPRPRPRTAFPRTDTLEAKDRNVRGQGQGPRTQAQVLSKKKKRSSQKFFKRSHRKNIFQKIFQALHKILTILKIVLSSSRGQHYFRGLEASRPRPRSSKCVLEDSTSVFCHIFVIGEISIGLGGPLG